MKTVNYLKAGFTVLLAVYGVICASDVDTFHMLDRVNLMQKSFGNNETFLATDGH